MAEVRTVGQVVGPQRPHHQLEQVGGLVGGSARAVGGHPLRGQGKGRRGQGVNFFPANGFVVVRPGPANHRKAEATEAIGFAGGKGHARK